MAYDIDRRSAIGILGAVPLISISQADGNTVSGESRGETVRTETAGQNERTIKLYSIDRSLNLEAEIKQSSGTSTPRPNPFNWRQVEPLLDQAAVLLDRGLQTRAEWDVLAAQAYMLDLQSSQDAQLEAIHEQEANAGLYDWMAQQASLLADAEQRFLDGSRSTSDAISKLKDIVKDRAPEVVRNARRAAHLSFFTPYWYDSPQLRHADVKDPASIIVYPYPTPATVTYYPPGTAPNPDPNNMWPPIASELGTKAQLEQSFEITERQLEIDRISSQAAGQASELRQKAAQVQSDWENKNKEFRRLRMETMLNSQHLRNKESKRAGSALNFEQRMGFLAGRYERDLRDAISRMRAASTGLSILYGYDLLLPGQRTPPDPFPAPKQEATREFYEECVLWIREAISFLVSFGQSDQSYIQSLSLKTILGSAKFAAGLTQKRWILPVTEQMLKEQWGNELFSLRLRGFSISVAHPDPVSVWQISLKVPEESFARVFRGDGGGTELKKFLQTDIPICRYGRATSLTQSQSSDIAGMVALYNAAPFGDWTVNLHGPISSDYKATDISDVQLDLHLLFRS